jgi:hypothetical protein
VISDAVRDLYRARWGEPSRQARFDVDEFGIEILSGTLRPHRKAWRSIPRSVQVRGRSWRVVPATALSSFVGLLPEQDGIASALAALGLYGFVRASRWITVTRFLQAAPFGRVRRWTPSS